MIAKRDYYLAAAVGFFGGIFAAPTLINLGIRNVFLLGALPLIIPPILILGVWLGKVLSGYFSFISQFSKYAAVGFLGAAIDFGVLNILSIALGVTAGLTIGWVNIPGFLLAVINAYVWNKTWVFENGIEGGLFKDFPKFLAVTVAGLLINSGIIILATTYIPPIWGTVAEVRLNLAKITATIVVIIWNFSGYKFLVFGSRSNMTSS
mgnify:CR=1 FL=1